MKIFGVGVAIMALFLRQPAVAQHTIFNVPSADVLPAKTVYLEVDNYFRTWSTSSGTAHQIYGRGVVGVGGGVPIKYRGDVIGAVASSGAVGGDKDEICSQAGIDAVADQLK